MARSDGVRIVGVVVSIIRAGIMVAAVIVGEIGRTGLKLESVLQLSRSLKANADNHTVYTLPERVDKTSNCVHVPTKRPRHHNSERGFFTYQHQDIISPRGTNAPPAIIAFIDVMSIGNA